MRALLPVAVRVAPAGGPPVPTARIAAGNLEIWRLPPVEKDLLIDPDRGRFSLAVAPPAGGGARVVYHVGAPGPVGAGGWDRRATVVDAPDRVVAAAGTTPGDIAATDLIASGVVEIPDSANYIPSAGATGIVDLTLQAANFARPYVRLAGDWIFTSGGAAATLVLDGLWIGASAPAAIRLRGAFDKVTLRHVTLDPGGTNVDGGTLQPVPLVVEGSVTELVVERAILASISLAGTGEVRHLRVSDSIIDPRQAGGTAITLTPADVALRRVTALGALDVERLDASDTLVTGIVDVTDTQHGCFRFSGAAAGSRLPHAYRAVTVGDPNGLFESRRFGQPGYAVLREPVDPEIERGAERGSEMGAWSSLMNPVKADGLGHKIDEYLPFGLIPALLRQT
jgi:hypothetical protein